MAEDEWGPAAAKSTRDGARDHTKLAEIDDDTFMGAAAVHLSPQLPRPGPPALSPCQPELAKGLASSWRPQHMRSGSQLLQLQKWSSTDGLIPSSPQQLASSSSTYMTPPSPPPHTKTTHSNPLSCPPLSPRRTSQRGREKKRESCFSSMCRWMKFRDDDQIAQK